MVDNVTVLDSVGASKTAAAKDIGAGVLAPKVFLVDGTGTDAIGEVSASPTANTLLARVKSVEDKLTTLQTSVAATNTALGVINGAVEYETVAASATDQIAGATGAVGDYLAGVLIIPATTSPGAVSVKDGNGTAITLFAGGASSVSNLVPFFVPLGINCVNATTPGWKLTTGTNVSAIFVGNFT